MGFPASNRGNGFLANNTISEMGSEHAIDVVAGSSWFCHGANIFPPGQERDALAKVMNQATNSQRGTRGTALSPWDVCLGRIPENEPSTRLQSPQDDVIDSAICKGSTRLGLAAGWMVWLFVFIFPVLSVSASTPASISLSNLTHTYNGSAKSATVTTVPSGLAYTITYNGSTTAPVNAGSYAVVATLVDEPVTATGTLVINKANISISFPSLAEKNYGSPPYTISATVNPTSSGLVASFASSDPEIATVSGNTVTIVGAGTTTITASQPGNANYNPAADVNRTLTVVGLPQTVTLDTFPAGKTYGDAPFSVSGSSSTGLPVTFRSSDPSVATVSGNIVTMVGAGHCSIIAEQVGNSVYAEASMARPLTVTPADLPMPPPAISTLYDGSPKGIDPVNLPGGAATQIRYRLADQPDPGPVPQLAFQNGPNTLANSYLSIGLHANGYWSMGKSIGLAGTARKLHSCDVTLVTWAQYNTVVNYGFLNWANNNPGLVVPPPDINNMTPGNTGGWYHPITLTIHDYDDEARTWRCLAEQTVTTLIPWRPMKLANGSSYTSNGYAFRVPFTFPDGVILPDDVFVSVGFNTSTQGRQSIGAVGPYDALNIANPGSVIAGTDNYPDYTFYEKNWDWWSPKSTGGPMLRLWTVPTNETLTPPVAAGTYHVKTVLTGRGVQGAATTAMTIGKAQATVTLGDLSTTYTGTPKSASVTTVPEGLAVTLTYDGSESAPTGVGSYSVVATVNDPNHEGTAVGTLVIGKVSQTIAFGSLPAGKKYGDGPIAVGATVNTGLPITFRSSDPSVATVSGNIITIVGAGQCSIFAIQEGDASHAYAAVAQPLFVAPADHLSLPPATIVRTYDGAPKGIDPATLSVGAASQIRYRNQNQHEPAPVPQVVFQNGPDNLAPSYSSVGLQANGYWGLGKAIGLGGSARKLHSCDVTLVTWARYNNEANYGFLNWANTNPSLVVPPSPGISIPGNSGGWYHPVTLTIFDYDDAAGTWTCLARKTVQALIPWRPMTLADGTTYPYNGHAFRVEFSFPDGVILPDDVFVSVNFNTSLHGEQPLGSAGPYDALNLAQPGVVSIGTDHYPDSTIYWKNWHWFGPDDPSGPMLRLRTVPTNESLTPPTDVGTYEVKTVPTGIGVSIPAAISTLTIGYDFAGWKAREIAEGRLPAGQSGDTDDPDKDGLTNLQEYAFNLNPGAPESGLPGHPARLSFLPPHLGFTYRRNPQAVDLTYSIEGSNDLADPASWNPLAPLEENMLSDDGETRVIEATVPKPADAPGYFLRLKVSRNPLP